MEILKGLPVANAINEKIAKTMETWNGAKPHLAIIRVGERPDDMSYERGALKKMEKVDNLHVQMDTDKISATGQVKLLGRMADITLEGKVLPENGGLYFHMTRLDIRNAVLGQAVLGNFFGDILIFDLYNSPIRAEIDDVQQQAGQVTIKAVRKEGNSLQ